MDLSDKHILLGVTGSIAAFKAILILRRLTLAGARVTVVLTRSAQQFVTPLTFQVLSRRPVYTDLFDSSPEIRHLTLAEEVDLILIAPATANLIGKLAGGIADDLLSTIALASPAPVVVAPAMDGEMWNHPLLKRNLAILDSLGYRIVPPAEGSLASGKEGIGRLASEEEILSKVAERLARRQDLAGETVLVTAGPTQEPIDPVRYLTNRSSGKMGFALARAAQERGARVILVSGPTALSAPARIKRILVRTAAEMREAVMAHFPEASVLIMAAAVADYRPVKTETEKIDKRTQTILLELEPTEDILSELGSHKGDRIVIGFAAETREVLTRAEEKLRRKALDLIVANDLTQEGAGFDIETNVVTMIRAGGERMPLPRMLKSEVADRILDQIRGLRSSTTARTTSNH